MTNMVMEEFESKDLSLDAFKLKLWKIFVDDTCSIWKHGQDKLDSFFEHLNSQSNSIEFTMESDVDGCLPFLNVLVSRKVDGSFFDQVYQKKSHAEQYLHECSNHFPACQPIIFLRILDEDHLSKEKSHPLNVFVQNGYRRHHGIKAFVNAGKGPSVKTDMIDLCSNVHLPFIQGMTDKIARTLKKNNVPSTFRPLNTIRSSLKFVKNQLNPMDLKGVYVIPCSCGI